MWEGAQSGSFPEEITPPGFNVRTLVHEYGGGAFAVKRDNVVFSNYADQRLYKQSIRGGTLLSNLDFQSVHMQPSDISAYNI